MVWPFKKTISVSKPKTYNFRPGFIREIHQQNITTKGIINREQIGDVRFGEEHPFEFSLMRDLYKKIPIVSGAIEVTVNSVVGKHILINSKNESIKKFAEDFIRKQSFDILLRNIVKDILIYGNAFIEIVTVGKTVADLIIRNPETMYVRRDEFGNVIGYTQRTREISSKKITKEDVILFEPHMIAHFKLNVIGDSAYGLSIIAPLEQSLTRKLSLEDSMTTLARRKANAPIVAYLGDRENQPQDADINAVASDLEYLDERTEWVFPWTVKLEALDVASKLLNFEPFNRHFENQIIYGLQVPAVLLGLGSVPEGLATAQMEMFEKRIESIRINVSEILTSQILNRHLESLGITDFSYEIQWEPESEDDKWEEVKNLMEIINSFSVSPQLKLESQKRVAQLLDIKIENMELPEPQGPIPFKPQESINEKFLNSLPIKEFVGMDFRPVMKGVMSFLATYGFENIADITIEQKEILRDTLSHGFARGGTINKLAKEINDKVFNGQDEARAFAIARTETVRATNAAFEKSYEARGIEKVKWVSVIDSRTDEDCENLDGEEFNVGEHPELPLHPFCRCRLSPIL